MPNSTTNYGLVKPLASELYDIEVFNENADIIDETLKTVDTCSKTSASTLKNHEFRLSNTEAKVNSVYDYTPRSFSYTGNPVVLENYETMPIECEVQSAESTSVKVARCGKNLFGGTISKKDGYEEIVLAVPLPPGTYTVSGIVTSTDTDVQYSSFAFRNSSAMIGACRFTRSQERETFVVTTTDYTTFFRIHAGSNLSNSAGDTCMWTNVQVENGNTATDYALYQADVYTATPGETITIPALDGTNTLYTNGDSLTVSGRQDILWLTKHLEERIKPLEDRLTYGTTDLTAGTSKLATGEVYLVYAE